MLASKHGELLFAGRGGLQPLRCAKAQGIDRPLLALPLPGLS
jgi:hypothetical protein